MFSATLVPPGFTKKLKTTHVQEGDSVKLVVQVQGDPPPNVNWYRDGNQLVSSPDFQISQDGNIHTLYIPEAFFEDSGKFSAKADNPAGEAICSAQIHIERK